MDAFVKTFFSNFNSPGLAFGPLEEGMCTNTFLQGSLRTFEADGQTLGNSRSVRFMQPMTMMGKMDAEITTSPSSFDGISKPYLTPEGRLNLSMIGHTLRQYTGQMHLQAANGNHKCWRDNHVTLLLNAMRYAFIAKFIEHGSLIEDKLPMFDDGRVRIDPNQWWANYPETQCWVAQEWPAGNDPDHFPAYVRLLDEPPAQDIPALDLRGLTVDEARFILLMLGRWQRRSRMRLDFALPKLADKVYYRSDVDVPVCFDELSLPLPAPPNSSVAWRALVKYVEINRIFSDFSTTLHLFCSIMYQFLPRTAEGQIWHSFDWKISLPSFYSVRGRYIFLTEEEAAYTNRRSLDEWSYIATKMEKIHLMAVVFVQAVQTGMAIRSVRHGLEIEPQDLIESSFDFYMPANMMAAAAEAAVGFTAPLTGMPGVHVTVSEDFDKFYPDRRIRVVEVNKSVRKSHDVDKHTTDGLAILAQRTTFAGVPTLILPIKPFPYNSIFSLKGTVAPDMGEIRPRGFRLRANDAWLVNALYTLAGYELSVKFNGETCGNKEYETPADTNFTWPVLFKPDNQEDPVTIYDQTDESVHDFDLPYVANRYFEGHKVDFDIRPMRRGCTGGAGNHRSVSVEEYGGVAYRFF